MSSSQAHDLSGISYTGGQWHAEDRFGIVVSKWNNAITEALCQGASSLLQKAGVLPGAIIRADVPGSFELPLAAELLLKKYGDLDGVICLGCVIRGETRHFEFISQAVADGIMRVGLDFGKPVIFGVLTPDSQEQAMDRAGGRYGNKGEEAAVSLLEMVDLSRQV